MSLSRFLFLCSRDLIRRNVFMWTKSYGRLDAFLLECVGMVVGGVGVYE